MENEFGSNLEDSKDLKSLEDFFSKDINLALTPQEIMVMSLSLSHVVQILHLYRRFTNIAVFDVKQFVKEHPEYANIDFNNLDEDSMKTIRSLLGENTSENEEFNKGEILINSIIDSGINIAMKLTDSYISEYNKMAPEDTIQLFTMLENCLAGSLKLVQAFFTQEPL